MDYEVQEDRYLEHALLFKFQKLVGLGGLISRVECLLRVQCCLWGADHTLIVFIFLYVGQNIFLHYRTLSCKSIVIVRDKQEKKKTYINESYRWKHDISLDP